MSSTPIRHDVHGYLQDSRRTVLRCVDGLEEYELRRPRTPTGTNLLGVVKHLIGIEAGYLGLCLSHPLNKELPWIDDESAGPNRDMWAASDESPDYIVTLYRLACDHSDEVLAEVGLAAPATVPWWPAGARETTAAGVLARVLKDTAMHAGQLQILRELIDGQGGADQRQLGDDEWWRDHVAQLEQLASQFRS